MIDASPSCINIWRPPPVPDGNRFHHLAGRPRTTGLPVRTMLNKWLKGYKLKFALSISQDERDRMFLLQEVALMGNNSSCVKVHEGVA